MIEIVTDEHYSTISGLFSGAEKSICIISPFLSESMAELLSSASERGLSCSFITRFYMQDFLDGSNTINGLRRMYAAGVDLQAIIGLHSKLYLFDEDEAIVGSANFTNSGLFKNVELSLHLSEEKKVIKDLREYFDSLSEKVRSTQDGIITKEMLDEAAEKYEKCKAVKKQPGASSYNLYMHGAILDNRARRIKENSNVTIEEFKSHADERTNDVVFSALGGYSDAVSYKTPKNIILKFSSSSKKRHNGTKPMNMASFTEKGKKIYISNFSRARKNSAETIEDGDETFFCVHSYDKAGHASPMIVGYGRFRQYEFSNDARTKSWFSAADWLNEYPIYCVIQEAHIIDAPVNCGIPLREMTDKLGYLTYMHTREHPDKYPKEKVANSHGQQAMLYLSPEARDYLNTRLRELGKEYGWRIFESE